MHVDPLQEMVPLVGGAGHAAQLLPHEAVLVLLLATHVVPQAWNPVLQLTPHVAELQIGFPFAGSAHAVQPLAVQPDAVLLLATHEVGFAVGQPWKPALQVTLHTAPLQLGLPFAGSAHAVQPPAVHPDATLLLATHVPAAAVPHRW